MDNNQVQDIDESEGINDDSTDKLVRHQVNEVKLYGDIETGSIALSGMKVLLSGNELKLKSPKVPLDDKDYPFLQDLVAAAINMVAEVTAYHNGKSRPESQISMFQDAEVPEQNK